MAGLTSYSDISSKPASLQSSSLHSTAQLADRAFQVHSPYLQRYCQDLHSAFGQPLHLLPDIPDLLATDHDVVLGQACLQTC